MASRRSKMFIKEPRIVLRDLKNISRQEVRIVKSLLTELGHLHTVVVFDTPMCRKCREIEETLYH